MFLSFEVSGFWVIDSLVSTASLRGEAFETSKLRNFETFLPGASL